MKHNNLFLVGLMGVGKTTIGRQLARALKSEFLDSDHEIERRTGADIPWIFDIEGEDGFRKREKQVIADLVTRQGVVLATGGGAVLDPDNRRCLADNGLVVYLYADTDILCKRTARDRNRPLLQLEDPRARLEALLAQRDPLYREIADIIVDTGRHAVAASVQIILNRLSSRENHDTTSNSQQDNRS